MARTCDDLLKRELVQAMGCNDGAGPDDQATCSEIADRLERLVETQSNGLLNESEAPVLPSERWLFDENLNRIPNGEKRSRFVVGESHVRDFITFLRTCGGFSVC